MFTVKSDQIIDSILVQTTQSSSNILPKWILSSYPQRTHTPRTPREKRTDINIYLITHTHTQNKSSSEIAFVVLRLHCQLKVVPDGVARRRKRRLGGLATVLLLPLSFGQLAKNLPPNCPTDPTNFGLVFRSPRTLRVFGDLMSNISATRGRPDMRFCVCGSPSEDLSHIASLTIGCSR